MKRINKWLTSTILVASAVIGIGVGLLCFAPFGEVTKCESISGYDMEHKCWVKIINPTENQRLYLESNFLLDDEFYSSNVTVIED